MKKKNVQLRVVLLVGLAVMIGGCGGGGGSGSPPINPGIVGGGGNGGGDVAPGSRPTGTLSVSFSDAPISEQFSNALLSIREVRLIATDPNETSVAVILPEALEIDLLQLASFPETLFNFSVPIDAMYYAVNVLVDSLTLVRADGSRISVLLPEFDSVREGMVVERHYVWRLFGRHSSVVRCSVFESDGSDHYERRDSTRHDGPRKRR